MPSPFKPALAPDPRLQKVAAVVTFAAVLIVAAIVWSMLAS